MYSFTVTTRIAAPIHDVFDLARDVDAHVRSQQISGERAVAGVTSGLLGPSDEVTWRATHFGLRFRMTARIVEFDRPTRFVDEQVRGPFASYRHTHRFEEVGDVVMMSDDVEFTAPLGPLGHLFSRAVLGDYMEQLIRERAKRLRVELEQ